MFNRQTMIEKIKALMAKANDNGATEAESLSFMEKAFELLAKYNIDENDVKHESIDVNIDETLYKMSVETSWFSSLAESVANLYFCRTIHSRKYEAGRKSVTHYYKFVGKEHNRLMAVSMFDYLMKTMHRLARNHSDNVKAQYEFKKGCSLRLAWRVLDMVTANKKAAPTSNNGAGGLPALYNTEMVLVDDFMSGKNLSTRNKTTVRANNSSFHVGNEAAKGISLNNQINTRQTSKFLLA